MQVFLANKSHLKYVQIICDTISKSAKEKEVNIAIRTPVFIANKIKEGNAVVALDKGDFMGFCYLDLWQNNTYVVHSGLIVAPNHRNLGVAKQLKIKLFQHSKEKYPNAKVFGITTSSSIVKINRKLGYQLVSYCELTTDKGFWDGCKTCDNYNTLISNDYKKCYCTGMLYCAKSNNI